MMDGVQVQPLWMDGMVKVVGVGDDKPPWVEIWVEVPYGGKMVSQELGKVANDHNFPVLWDK
jgi:hypothetical protein